MGKKDIINFNCKYESNDDYTLEAKLNKLNLDKVAEYDIATNRGFRITTNEGTKKDILSSTSIYSNRYGETAYGENPFVSRYKCKCGQVQGKKYSGTFCPKCGTTVEFVDDDFGFFGYLILDNYEVIHPIIFRQLEKFIGEKALNNIILLDVEKDEDGHVIGPANVSKSEPFYGIGMISFRKRFYEILEFYRNKFNKKPEKMAVYRDIIRDPSIIFTHSIPVYSVHLRPIKVSNGKFDYDKANNFYNMMSRNVIFLNKNKYPKYDTKPDKLLYDIQMKFLDLYDYVVDGLKSKTGDIRSVFGGRYNFTTRAVIVPKPGRIDELELPYIALSELLAQAIINVLVKTNSMSPNDAYNIWDKAKNAEDSKERTIVKNIINNIIKNSDRGIPILLNRNPTIEFGSIQQFYVTSMNEGYSIGIPLQNLGFFAADFDGDELNAHYIINKAFRDAAVKIFNPRNAFYVSHNDGCLNSTIIHNKDLLININSLRGMVDYNEEQLQAIYDCLNDDSE